MSLNEILAPRAPGQRRVSLSARQPCADGLIALHRLGASDARLDEWYEIYRKPMASWRRRRPWRRLRRSPGTRARRSRARDRLSRFFTAEVRRLGPRGASRRYYPARSGRGGERPASADAARLCDDVNDADEAGVALGYWAACHLPRRARRRAPDTDDPRPCLPAWRKSRASEIIRQRRICLAQHPRRRGVARLRPVVDRLKFGPHTPRRLAATAIALFAGTMDFAALHALTGLHWVRLVADTLDDAEPLYRAFWQAIAALVPKIGFPAFPSEAALATMRKTPAPPWPDIHAVAVASRDEHDISLTYSAWREEAVWRDPLYRVVAARRLGLMS